jgi:ABC-type Fe3+/spermidine/putrescine transport system ATPase subunit
LRIADVTKRFGDTLACDHVTFEVAAGEVLGLLGPSGCGKTTLLRCLAGFEDLTAGEVHLDGQLVADGRNSVPPERRRIGMVFQSYALWPHMTVEENVGMPLRLRGLSGRDRVPLVAESLRKLGLGALGKRYPSELSGGQQQRVALARATVAAPDLLLLDEPLSNLDALLREKLRDELRDELKDLGITTIFVTHDQAEAMAICDRVALLSSGRLVQLDTPRELYESPGALFAATFIGRANVLPGVVTRWYGPSVSVEVSGIGELIASPRAAVDVGEAVAVVVRPEHLSLGGRGEQVNRLKASVARSVFMGNRVDCVVNAGSQVLRAEAVGWVREPVAGEEIELTVPWARTLCFPQTGPAGSGEYR